MDTERAEAIADGMEAVMVLLPDWSRLAWREKAHLADALDYLGRELRDASRAENATEMRLMHEAGVG